MSKEQDDFAELLGNDLNPIDKGRIISRAEGTYGIKIAVLKDQILEYLKVLQAKDKKIAKLEAGKGAHK